MNMLAALQSRASSEGQVWHAASHQVEPPLSGVGTSLPMLIRLQLLPVLPSLTYRAVLRVSANGRFGEAALQRRRG